LNGVPRPGERWQHYKGAVVVVRCMGVDEKDGDIMVGYTHEDEPTDLWFRKWLVWCNWVADIHGRLVPRFVRLSEGEDYARDAKKK
jgi:hypothetical protein